MGPNIKYEFAEIERIVAAWPEDDSDERLVSVTTSMMASEIDRIKKVMIGEIFAFSDESLLQRYIRHHQTALVRLIDEVEGKAKRNYTGDRNLHESFVTGLTELLHFIERFFSKYFDPDADLPQVYLRVEGRSFRRDKARLFNQFQEMGADKGLVSVLLSPLAAMSHSANNKKTSYRELYYAKLMCAELNHLLEYQPRTGDLDRDLIDVAIFLNLNSRDMLEHFFSKVSRAIHSKRSTKERTEFISYELKLVNQAPQKLGVAYTDEAPALKHVLRDYLSEELSFQNKVLQNLQSNLHPLAAGFKVHFDMSVAQISLLTKLFVEAKLIENNNLTELLKVISGGIVTKKAERISYDSLRTKYYNVEQGTKDSLRTLFAEIMKGIERV